VSAALALQFTYLLNTEKLEYNYRVLTERDNENKSTLAAQKQRLQRLRAALAKAQIEYETSDKRYKERNAGLTAEYQRITRQYRDLQAKFKHFEVADAHRHAEVSETLTFIFLLCTLPHFSMFLAGHTASPGGAWCDGGPPRRS
jgi:hypothetical protein